MLFWTNKYRIKNKQVFSKLTPILIYKMISPIKHTKHLAQFTGKHETPIWYISLEAEYELKLVDKKCTRYTSQRKAENARAGFRFLS